MVETLENSALSWRIHQDAGICTVQFAGDIDETVDLMELGAWLSGTVEFHLQEVRHINSMGARAWVKFMRSMPAVTGLSMAYCSTAIVTHLNTISNFRGEAELLSFFAPYRCSGCDAHVSKLIDIKVCFPDPKITHPPTFTCDTCSHPLEFDELPSHYIGFLNQD